MTLSILIPTLTERKALCTALVERLTLMAASYPNQIEILTNEDNGGKSTGQKRNELVDIAKGKFSCFIDDDDDVPDYYFDSIFKVFKHTPDVDCIGFKGLIITKYIPGKQVRHTVFRHQHGLEFSSGLVRGEYLRPPNHLNPMLTDYFRKVRFPDLTFAEDFDFCMRLKEMDLIKNHVFLDIVMYHYKFDPNKRSPNLVANLASSKPVK